MSTSTSLSGRNLSVSTDPNKASRRTPCFWQKAATASFGMSIRAIALNHNAVRAAAPQYRQFGGFGS